MKVALSIDPSRAAVLCVDLQEEHRKDSRYLVEGFDRILENVQRIQATARAAGVPVLHSAYVVDLSSQPANSFHPVMPDGKSAFSDISDSLSAICAEVGAAADEIVLIKTDASSFAQGDIGASLKARETEFLFVVGVWTEACIAATVKDAIGLGFHVILIKDACGSGSTAMHETAIINLANRLYGGAVTDTAGACRLLTGDTIEAWMVQGSVPLRFTYENAVELYRNL